MARLGITTKEVEAAILDTVGRDLPAMSELYGIIHRGMIERLKMWHGLTDEEALALWTDWLLEKVNEST